MSDTAHIGESIRAHRLRAGLSLDELARPAGISRVALNNIELGKSVPRDETAIAIANALRLSLPDLRRMPPMLAKVRFRAPKKLKSREAILVEAHRRIEEWTALEKKVGVAAPMWKLASLASMRLSGPDGARQLAGRVREILHVPTGPVPQLVRAVEHFGVKVIAVEMAADFFGLSIAEEDGGPAIVVNVGAPITSERIVFSIAHELGHLLMHLDAFDARRVEDDDGEEQDANIFASVLLMDEEGFWEAWAETRFLPFLHRVLAVKRRFGVSYKAVLYRLSETFGPSVYMRFQDAHRREFERTLTKADEPEPLPKHVARPMRFNELVCSAIDTGALSSARGAQLLRLPVETVDEMVKEWRAPVARPRATFGGDMA